MEIFRCLLILFLSSNLLYYGASSQGVSSLPACGQTCINNELGLAPSLGCSSTDAACLCKNVNFGLGIRDCANEACGTSVASTVISYASSYCSSALGSSSTGSAGAIQSSSSLSSTSTKTAVDSTSSTASSVSSSSSSTQPSQSSNPSQTSRTSLSSGPSSTIPTSTSTSSPAVTTSPSTLALSTGAKVGIGIGVAIGALILCVLAYIVILLRRKQIPSIQRADLGPRLPELGPGFTPEMETVEHPVELDTKKRKWWSGSQREAPSELQG